MANFNSVDEFRKACDEWLLPMGYSVHLQSSMGSYLMYSSTDFDGDQYEASIACTKDCHGEASVEVVGVTRRMSIHVKSGKLSFKHPHIKSYVANIHAIVAAHDGISDALAAREVFRKMREDKKNGKIP